MSKNWASIASKPASAAKSAPKTAAATAAPAPAVAAAAGAARQQAEPVTNPRVVFALANMVGSVVQVQTRNGAVYQGILHGIGVRNKDPMGVSLAMAFRRPDPKTPGEKVTPFGTLLPGPPSRDVVLESFVIAGEVVAQIAACGIDLSFRAPPPPDMDDFTDTGISRGFGAGMPHRELQKWMPDEDDSVLPISLDNSKGWSAEDMFARNEREHGIKSDYDENLYTVKLDTSAPDFNEKMKNADRVVREMQADFKKKKETNVHLLEERGLEVNDALVSEEDRYGAAHDDRYVAPALQQQQQQGKSPRQESTEKLKKFQNEFKMDAQAEGGADSGSKAAGGAGDKPAGEAKAEAPKKSTLNPDAPIFTFNPDAPAFVMPQRPVATAAPPHMGGQMPFQPQQQGYMRPPRPPYMGGGGQPVLGGMGPRPGFGGGPPRGMPGAPYNVSAAPGMVMGSPPMSMANMMGSGAPNMMSMPPMGPGNIPYSMPPMMYPMPPGMQGMQGMQGMPGMQGMQGMQGMPIGQPPMMMPPGSAAQMSPGMSGGMPQ